MTSPSTFDFREPWQLCLKQIECQTAVERTIGIRVLMAHYMKNAVLLQCRHQERISSCAQCVCSRRAPKRRWGVIRLNCDATPQNDLAKEDTFLRTNVAMTQPSCAFPKQAVAGLFGTAGALVNVLIKQIEHGRIHQGCTELQNHRQRLS